MLRVDYWSTLFCRQGVGPTAQRAAIVAGVELPAYDFFKKHIILSGLLGDCRQTHFLWVFSAAVVLVDDKLLYLPSLQSTTVCLAL